MNKETKTGNINLFLEIDPEKQVFYISDYEPNKNGGGVAKKFKTKKDIVKIFSRYLYRYINIYRGEINGR